MVSLSHNNVLLYSVRTRFDLEGNGWTVVQIPVTGVDIMNRSSLTHLKADSWDKVPPSESAIT